MIVNKDSLEFLKTFDDFTFDINYSDPPYQLGSEVIIRKDGKVDYKKSVDFMNKWGGLSGDYWNAWFKEAYRTLKHGGYLIMFGMDRQLLLFKYYANLAGFQEQQSLYWYFISNFPKATDLSKMIDKRGGGKFDTNHIAAAIKEARLKRKMTVSECDKLFCDSSTNWTWFEGRKAGVRPPTYDTFMKIANEWNELLPLAEAVKEAEREVVGKKEKLESYKYKNNNVYQAGGNLEKVELDITVPSTNLAKKYEGYKYSISPLKQTNETIMVFRKPYKSGSCLHDTLAFENGDNECRCGALNIDGNRVPSETPISIHNAPKGTFAGGELDRGSDTESYREQDGRYPSQTFCDSNTAEVLDRQSGVSKSVKAPRTAKIGGMNGATFNSETVGFSPNYIGKWPADNGGGCSKILHKCNYEQEDHDLYFYNPKVSKSERNAGCDGEPQQYSHDGRNKEIENPYQRNKSVAINNHPTLKPIKLNEIILKLFKTPNDDKIVYPFAGSGSEIIGGIKAGFTNWVGCEINPDYVEIAKARIDYWTTQDNQLTIFELERE